LQPNIRERNPVVERNPTVLLLSHASTCVCMCICVGVCVCVHVHVQDMHLLLHVAVRLGG
jgi:uncharacterized integral membrane protein